MNKDRSKGKHPKLHEMKVTLTNGEVIVIMTTSSKSEYQTDIDPMSHGAWTGETRIGTEQDSGVSKFLKKYGHMM
ncbi:MAG: 50S ribosomal protein L31 [Alphaproteobacteria bacterium]|nr:MAG: 50S ribosomal protein L31 [Alphaproteobacteria bacterium]